MLAAGYRQLDKPAAWHREQISKQREFGSYGPPTADLVGYLRSMAKKISKCDLYACAWRQHLPHVWRQRS
jgi:hypothetical protein